MRIVVISDTHSLHEKIAIPNGDILIHCGDITMSGSKEEIENFDRFLGTLCHKNKVVVAGNHDRYLSTLNNNGRKAFKNATYLEDSLIQIEGLTIYGSPWQPPYRNMSFNASEKDLYTIWKMIPKHLDILITHTPPYGICDKNSKQLHKGSKSLLEIITGIDLKFHFFGHIHEGYGKCKIGKTLFANASSCDYKYQLKNKPLVFNV